MISKNVRKCISFLFNLMFDLGLANTITLSKQFTKKTFMFSFEISYGCVYKRAQLGCAAGQKGTVVPREGTGFSDLRP